MSRLDAQAFYPRIGATRAPTLRSWSEYPGSAQPTSTRKTACKHCENASFHVFANVGGNVCYRIQWFQLRVSAMIHQQARVPFLLAAPFFSKEHPGIPDVVQKKVPCDVGSPSRSLMLTGRARLL